MLKTAKRKPDDLGMPPIPRGVLKLSLLCLLLACSAPLAGCLDEPTSSANAADTGGNGDSNCHPSYEGACLDANASDYDCEGGSGDGPEYTGAVTVIGPDDYDLDRDGDGSACAW